MIWLWALIERGIAIVAVFYLFWVLSVGLLSVTSVHLGIAAVAVLYVLDVAASGWSAPGE